jgi:hypothetical protein
MKSKSFGRVLRTALATAVLFGAQFASAADVAAGNTIKLTDGYPGTQGPFLGTVLTGAAAGNTFASFCLEINNSFNYGQTLLVGGVTDHTVSNIAAAGPSQNGDVLSSATAWLFTQFYNNALSGYSATSTNNNALQNSIWALENEISAGGLTGSAKTWYNAAIAATTGPNATWSGLGNVKVLNLFGQKQDRYGHYYGAFDQHAQDQIYMVSSVPEPGTYAMMLAGLGLMGTIARRRKNKTA